MTVLVRQDARRRNALVRAPSPLRRSVAAPVSILLQTWDDRREAPIFWSPSRHARSPRQTGARCDPTGRKITREKGQLRPPFSFPQQFRQLGYAGRDLSRFVFGHEIVRRASACLRLE